MRVLVAAVALSALIAAGLGCAGDDGGTDTGGLSAEEVVAQSAARFEELESFHFKLEHENGTTEIPLNLGLETAEGDVVLPDRLAANIDADAGPVGVSVKVVAIGDMTWITNPFTRQYQRLPGNTSLRDIADPAALVAAVGRSLRDPRIEGTESVGGVDCYRIKGTIQTDDLEEALSLADSGRTLEVDAWIGRDDLLLRRARLSGALVPDEDEDIVREITLSNFDAPVTIEAPQ
jgi:lipoprotein LprA